MIGLILFLVGSKGEQNENNKKDLFIWTKNDIAC